METSQGDHAEVAWRPLTSRIVLSPKQEAREVREAVVGGEGDEHSLVAASDHRWQLAHVHVARQSHTREGLGVRLRIPLCLTERTAGVGAEQLGTHRVDKQAHIHPAKGADIQVGIAPLALSPMLQWQLIVKREPVRQQRARAAAVTRRAAPVVTAGS